MPEHIESIRSFMVRAETLDEDERSVEAVLATEEPVLAFDLRTYSRILEVLRMDGFVPPPNNQVPLQDTHDRYSLQSTLGSTRDIRVEGEQLVGRNHYADNEAGENAWRLVKGGHVTDNSIGYAAMEYVDIPAGTTAEVNGRSYSAPEGRDLRITTKWTCTENSNCPIGADQLAKMRAKHLQHETPQTGGINMPEETQNTDEQREDAGVTEQAEASTAQRAETPEVAVEQIRSEAAAETRRIAREEAEAVRQAEAERVSAIRSEGSEYDVPADVVARCIEDGVTVDAARGEFLKAIRSQSAPAPSVMVRQDVPGQSQPLEAAFLLRAGVDPTADSGEDIAQQAQERFRNLSILDACRMGLRMAGHDAPVDREDLIRAGFTTGTLSNVLGNTANKLLLRGYNGVQSTWRSWCSVESLPDFKDHKVCRMNDLGELEEVGSGGEVNAGERGETSETISIATYAKNFKITRQDVINDDLGVFTKIPMGHGVKAAQRLNKLVYTHLLANGDMSDSVALFHADHANLNTSTALTAANLATAMAAFFNQTGPDGEPLDVYPAVLLVPPGLFETGKQLCSSPVIMPVGSTDARTPTANVTGTMLKNGCVVEPRLANSNYTGYSATSWYLMADPAEADTTMVAFLNGKQTPTLERFGYDHSADVLGITFRVYHDFGVKAVDYRTMQKNTA